MGVVMVRGSAQFIAETVHASSVRVAGVQAPARKCLRGGWGTRLRAMPW